MGKRKILSADHARALLKEALGKIHGDQTVAAEGAAEVAVIEAENVSHGVKSKRRRPVLK